MQEKSTIRTALTEFSELTWSDALFADKSKPLTIDSPCLIHDPDDVDDEEVDLPDVAISLGFDYLIDIQTFKAICLNMLEQKPLADTDDLFHALSFYLKNDAFIVL